MGLPSFRIVAAERLKYGSLVAAATIAVPGLGKFEVSIFAPAGKPAFAKPRSIGDQHIRTFWLDPAFADGICAAVLERLAVANAAPITPKADQTKSPARRRPRRSSRPAPSAPTRFATTAERDAYFDRQEQALEQRLLEGP
jgi:hypothetical protein